MLGTVYILYPGKSSLFHAWNGRVLINPQKSGTCKIEMKTWYLQWITVNNLKLFFHKLFFLINLFVYFLFFWLCWVFVSVRGLSLVAASGGHSSSRCVGLSLSRPLFLQSTGSRCASSVVVAHGPSCSAACEIFPDQGSNPCPLHWQADS